MTPSRKALLITAIAVIALIIFISTHQNGGGVKYIPVRIEHKSKSLVSMASCQPLGVTSFLVIGYLDAPVDSGIVRIGATVHFSGVGPSHQSLSYDGWYTYFDTSDPLYREYGSGGQQFTVKVDVDSSAQNLTPKYCEVSASYFH